MAKLYGNRWKVTGDIADSGQARVFKVVDESGQYKGEYALKRLKNPKRKNRFEAELKALDAVENQSVVKPIDLSLEDPAFYVTPFFKEGSLRKHNCHQWPIERVFDFFSKFLEILEACHDAGIVHRDIKPDNILVSDSGDPVVIDFGICYIDGDERVTMSEEQLGSRNYIAPELEKGRYDEVDQRSDIYSSGKVLYWMLSGLDLPRESFLEDRFKLTLRTEKKLLSAIELLLLKSVTESPGDRIEKTSQFRNGVDRVFYSISNGGNIPSAHVDQICQYCKIGVYKPTGRLNSDGSSQELGKAGMTNYSGNPVRLMHCSVCGHFQMFTTQNPFKSRWADVEHSMLWLFKENLD